MTELIVFFLSGLALIYFVCTWIGLHGWKPRAGVKIGNDAFDVNFWGIIISSLLFVFISLSKMS